MLELGASCRREAMLSERQVVRINSLEMLEAFVCVEMTCFVEVDEGYGCIGIVGDEMVV